MWRCLYFCRLLWTFYFICFVNLHCIERQGTVIHLHKRSLVMNALSLCLGAEWGRLSTIIRLSCCHQAVTSVLTVIALSSASSSFSLAPVTFHALHHICRDKFTPFLDPKGSCCNLFSLLVSQIGFSVFRSIWGGFKWLYILERYGHDIPVAEVWLWNHSSKPYSIKRTSIVARCLRLPSISVAIITTYQEVAQLLVKFNGKTDIRILYHNRADKHNERSELALWYFEH